MTNRVFVDTNVFIYSVSDPRLDSRVEVAELVVAQIAGSRSGVISAQVVGEFLSACKRRLDVWVTPADALRHAKSLCEMMTLHPLTENAVHEALRARERYGLNYFDAQIWACARLSGCAAIITEDTHGPEIEGVRYVSPFAEDFDLAALLAG